MPRPKADKELKRELYTLRLPKFLLDWLKRQPHSIGRLVEEALVDKHNIKPPD